jgi:hypothetical protein
MSDPGKGERISRQKSSAAGYVGIGTISTERVRTRQWFSDATNRHNMIMLAMISAFLAGVDTFQSFYLQRVVNEFNEVNLLPLKFYSHGLFGYLLYTPVDFLALYATLIILWIWASYLLWYYKEFLSPRLPWGSKRS